MKSDIVLETYYCAFYWENH